jgi:putative PIN family toxin of toxin-antitoxin system
MKGRVVFDTSSLVSASLRPSSVPDRALTLALKNCQLCSCADSLGELEEVLHRPRFDAYVGRDTRMAFYETIRRHSQIFALTGAVLNQAKGQCRDGTDDFILALALAAQAEVIVTSDEDLLVLHPWQGVAILTPAEFLSRDKI